MADTEQNQKKPRVPEWATEHIQRFLDESQRLYHVLRLTVRGISILRNMPKLVELLAKFPDTDGQRTTSVGIDSALKEAELATSEFERGFPVVHGQAIVTQWTLLEAMIRSFLVAWLRNEPSAMQADAVQKLKIRLGEYDRLKDDERFMFIIQQVEQENAAGLRHGADRFESILRPFDLSGPIPEKLRETIFEWAQIRNCLVHRAGVVDMQLANLCPWLKLPVGTTIQPTHEMAHRYQDASMAYVMLLMCRLGERYGIDVREDRTGLETVWCDKPRPV